MLNRTTLERHISQALEAVEIDWPHGRERGKVRDTFLLPDGRRLIVTTDRLSAFDRILTAVPFKGQVLNQLSAFWFEQTADIIPNHVIDVPDPNTSLVVGCETLPVEVVVRGYITGVTKTALWYRYSLGERHIYGYDFPDGLVKNQPLPEPIITPTTKGLAGEHDERITCAEVVERGLLDKATWEQAQTAALAIFRRGQEIARQGGLILVDTKYEFGRAPDGKVMVIDEVHTPDSSRFWLAESYEERVSGGEEPDNFDKEFLRLWYADHGYRGDGEPPEPTDDLVAQVSERYIALYEKLAGRTFEPGAYPANPRIAETLKTYL
ncbi:MAG: phosphoribosylaminoimidazolesuccinocarboxamide synthase [Anaerolineae bacterium]|jgi:phosphoribosylaminoimidazole-succinocarboxamide synthase|nr:phosphoribosylaminoimidazolesuccinocarboxamide synthase [Anaerolineae bacterium]